MIRNGDFGMGLIPGIFGILALITGIAIYQQSAASVLGTQPSRESSQAEEAKPGTDSNIRQADKLLAEFLNVDLAEAINKDSEPDNKEDGKENRKKSSKQDTDEDPEQGHVAYLFKQAAAAGILEVNLVIATIPDYVDSSGYWVADQMIDAIQRGAAALGYQLDRYWLPDSEIAVDSTVSPSKLTLHETQPGVILFRRVVDHSNANVHLLAAFLVNEIPTTGIHQKAFFEAVQIASEWGQKAQDNDIDGPGADGELLVLGPTFSGSALSLRSAIEDLNPEILARFPKGQRIVSGTATNPKNLELLTFSNTTFSATVHTDDELLTALGRYLGKLNRDWIDGNRVALIMESNTVYGSGFEQKAGIAKLQNEGESGSPKNNGSNGDTDSNEDDFSKAIRMTFPIHISRLRSAAGTTPGQSGTASGSQSPKGIGINMGVRSLARDRIPSFAPDMTSAVVELTLANILDTIERENVGAVGIFTTDKRDHLFLSREIIRRAPNVLLFATESDLLLIQREFRSFIKGTIVASSYPLFSGTQWLTNGTQAAKMRMQFPSMGTQGVYNAMLALLDLPCFIPGSGKPIAGEPDPRPLDYAFFRDGDDSQKIGLPPVWISVAGRNAFWPITIDDGKKESQEESPEGSQEESPEESITYMIPTGVVGNARETGWITPSTLALFLLVVVTLAFLSHGFAYLVSIEELTGNPKSKGMRIDKPFRWLHQKLQDWAGKELPFARHYDSRRQAKSKYPEEPVLHERRRFLLIRFTILGLVAFWLWRLFIVWKWGEILQTTQGNVWLTILVLFIITVIVGFVFTMIDRASWACSFLSSPASNSGSIKDPSGHSVWHFCIATGTAALMLVPAVIAIWALWRVLTGAAEFPLIYENLLLIRTLSVSNGVSQAAIVLFLSAAVYIWARWNVRQLSMRGDHYEAGCGLFRLLGGEPASAPKDTGVEKPQSEPLRLELRAVLASPWRRTRPGLLAVVLLIVVSYGFFIWDSGYGIDGIYFSRFIRWLTLLAVFVCLHSLSQTMHLSNLLGRVLRNLVIHRLAPAFKRIAEDSLFKWRLTVRPSSASELRPVLNLAQSLKTEEETEKLQIAADSILLRPREAFLRNKAWGILLEIGERIQEELEQEHEKRTEQEKLSKQIQDKENLLALLSSFVIRDMLSRLIAGLSAAFAMALFICAAHMFSSFHGRHLFVWLDIFIIAALVLIGAITLRPLDKDKILGPSLSSTPGRFHWMSNLKFRSVIGVAVTLLTILAARFPELGTALLGWLEPLKNIP